MKQVLRVLMSFATMSLTTAVTATPSEFTVLLAEGDPAPYAGDDLNITRMYFGDFNSNGQLAATVSVPREDGLPGTEQFLVATECDGSFRVVTRNGIQLAGTGIGPYQYALDSRLIMNDEGQVAFETYNTSALSNHSAWSEVGGLHLVGGKLKGFADDGDLLAGGNTGVNSSWMIEDDGVLFPIYCRGASFAQDGTLIYSVRRSGAGFTSLNDDIVYRRTENGVEVLTQDGDQAWGMPDGFRFASIKLAFDYPKNDPVFTSSLVLPSGEVELSESLFADTGGNQRLIARHGALAPGYGGGFVFDEFQDYGMTETGRAILNARVRNPNGGYDIGLFHEDGDDLELIVRSGHSVPGLPETFLYPELTYLNDSPVTGTTIANGFWYNNTLNQDGLGLWRIGEDDQWHLLLSTGETFEVSPGDIRTITSIWATEFTDDGVLRVVLWFSDETSAFVSWTDAPQRLPGDANGDGAVNAADYTLWRDGLGERVLGGYGADANGDRLLNLGDHDVWRSNFGQPATMGASALVPEPHVISFLVVFLLVASGIARKGRPN